MTEDPLERIEREEREKKNRNGSLKTATIILAVAALALGGALAWIWNQKSSLVNELEGEKAELTQQLLNLQSDFETLNSDYESINSQLDTSREQVALLIEKLSKTEATNRAKIRVREGAGHPALHHARLHRPDRLPEYPEQASYRRCRCRAAGGRPEPSGQ